MTLSKIFKNTFLVIMASLILTACATTKKVETPTSQMQGDVYTGTDTVEYLASGVPDRVFFATNDLMSYGVSANRISVISYGKERPVDSGSNPLAWSKNRRSVTVKAN